MIPLEMVQGDSYAWTESDSAYPASSGWVVHYELVSGSSRITFNSTADGDAHDFSLTAETTAAWNSGEYNYSRYVTDLTQRTTLSRGTVEVKKDFSTASDQRSTAQIQLDSINAVLEKRATLDQEEYSINNRSLKRMSISDLLMFRDRASAEVAREKNAERIARGLGTKQVIRTRF